MNFLYRIHVKINSLSSKTNIEGVVVASDVSYSHYRQAITAARMGCRGANDTERYLSEKGL